MKFKQKGQRLRKQPKLRRTQAAGNPTIPKIVVPPAAKKRKRRNRQSVNLPFKAVKQFIISARWMSLALLAVCIWVIGLIGQDESFYLKSIPVTGNVSFSAADIIAGSGLGDAHIFAADPNEAAARIGDLPGVISATVTLDWPNQATIAISEDTPVAVWVQQNDRYWVNETGDLVPARMGTTGLLTIEAEQESPFGEDLFLPDDVLRGALQLRELRPNIDHLYYRSGNGLSYQDGRGWRVYFGSGLDMAQKLAVYETLVEDLMSRSITPSYISVSNQEKPYYMLNGS